MKTFMTAALMSASLLSLVACANDPSSSNSGGGTLQTRSVKDAPTPYPVADAERSKAMDELIIMRRKMVALEGNIIAPAKEDLDIYADLLLNANAGLARLFPRNSSNERKPLLVSGGGSYYQFKNRTNEYGHGNDVEYSTTNSPQFSVGFAGVDFGLLAQLGTTDIRQIDEKNPAVAFLISYASSSGQPEPVWRAKQRTASDGVTSNGVVFKNRTEAIVGMSYAVRSVNEGDYDTVSVFQVVRRDPTDGSLIIAWKLLKELEKPVMKRN